MGLIFGIVLLLFSIFWVLCCFVAFVRALIDLKDIKQIDTDTTEQEIENSEFNSQS